MGLMGSDKGGGAIVDCSVWYCFFIGPFEIRNSRLLTQPVFLMVLVIGVGEMSMT